MLHQTRDVYVLTPLPLWLAALLGCTGSIVVDDGPTPTDVPDTPAPQPTPPVPTVVPTPAPPTEICDNGVDDDGDGATDCEDPDCDCPLFPFDTLLTDLGPAEWARICTAFAEPVTAASWTCADGSEVSREAASADDAFADCFATYRDSAEWSCTATYSDFVATIEYDGPLCPEAWPPVDAIAACFDPPVCAIALDARPASGTTDAYYRGDVVFTFDAVDPSVSVALSRPTGANVPGTGRWRGDEYVFTPDAPLDTSTTYTATATSCSGANTASTTFTTSSIGVPVPPPVLPGRTFGFDLGGADVQWTEPPTVGSVLAGPLSSVDAQLLLGITSATPTSLQLRLASGNRFPPVLQDPCTPTASLSASFLTNPFFTTAPVTLDVPVPNGTIRLYETTFSGAVAPSGDLVGGLTLDALLDTRDLVPLLVPNGPPGSACALLAPLGVTCSPCPGGGPFCVPVQVVQPVADEIPGLSLTSITTPGPTCP
jgi:hypothetical protein